MNKRAFRIVVLFSILFACVLPAYGQWDQRGIIVSGNLRVRTSPDLNGEVVGMLQAGETVTILDQTESTMKIGNMEDYWYKVVTPDIEGWTYGFFISLDFQYFPESGTLVYSGNNQDAPEVTHYHVFSPEKDYKFDAFAQIIEFSATGAYYYVASPRDMLLYFHDTTSGEVIVDGPYTGSEVFWEGDSLVFEAVMGADENGNLATVWLTFADGEIIFPGMDPEPEEEYEGDGGIGDKYAEMYAEDTSWERWTFFESENLDEMLYHVRVLPGAAAEGGPLSIVFLGIAPAGKGFYSITLYEYTEGEEPIEIDTFQAVVKFGDRYETFYMGDNYQLDSFIRRFTDNFIYDYGTLYYYKDVVDRDSAGRYYYAYPPQSGQNPFPIPMDEYNSLRNHTAAIYNQEDYGTILGSPGEQKTAYTDTYDIYVAWDTNQEYFFDIMSGDLYGYNLGKDGSGFRMSEAMGDAYYDTSFVIGSMCWDYQDRFIFFDNSGLDMRCIWLFDTMLGVVEKIVPEHEAIHPFYYEIGGESFIAYTEDNRIMIATGQIFGR